MGAVSARGASKLVFVKTTMNSQGYCSVLDEALLPLLEEKYGRDDEQALFQQDNASIHTSRFTRQWMDDCDIDLLPWPAKSPDLNVIENVWGWLVLEVYENNRQFETVSDLKEAIAHAWEKITPRRLKNLIESVPRRLADCIRNHGGATRY